MNNWREKSGIHHDLLFAPRLTERGLNGQLINNVWLAYQAIDRQTNEMHRYLE